MQILLQSHEILNNGEDGNDQTSYSEINNNLNELHNLAI